MLIKHRRGEFRFLLKTMAALLIVVAYLLVSLLSVFYFPEKYLFEGLVIILMAFLVVGALFLYHVEYGNPLGVLSPLYMFLLPYSIYFIFFPLDMIFRDKYLVDGQERYLPTLMVYLLAGLVAYLVGFFGVLRSHRRTLRHSNRLFSLGPHVNVGINLNTRRAAILVGVLMLLASCIWLFLIVRGGGIGYILNNFNEAYLSVFSKNMYLVSILNSLYFVILSLHFGIVLKRKKGYLFFTINCLVLLFPLLIQGSRGSIISVFLFVVVAVNMYVRRLKFLHVSLLFLSAIFFMTIWLYVRDVETGAGVIVSDIVYAAFFAVNDEITIVLNYLINMPSILDFKFGYSFVQLVLMPIPRIIWPNKPEVFQVESTRLFLPHYSVLDINWPPSIVGELYANFHVVGIVFGLLIFGFLCGRLQVYALRVNSYYRLLIYSILLFAVLREVRGDFATVTSLLIMQLVVFISIGRLVLKKVPSLSLFGNYCDQIKVESGRSK